MLNVVGSGLGFPWLSFYLHSQLAWKAFADRLGISTAGPVPFWSFPRQVHVTGVDNDVEAVCCRVALAKPRHSTTKAIELTPVSVGFRSLQLRL